MVYSPGEQVALSAFITRNGVARTGLEVLVRVVLGDDAEEILASTPVPETDEPGLYALGWTAPEDAGVYRAIYSALGRTYAEEILVAESSGSGAVAESLFVTVVSDEELAVAVSQDALTVKVSDGESLQVKLDEPESLSVEVSQGDITVKVEGC